MGVRRTSAPADGHPPSGEVDGGLADLDDGLLVLGAAAAGHGPEAGEQLVHAERLGDVVVGAGVEGVDLVDAVGATGQHQDRHVGPAPESGDHLGAVHVREAEVEDDHVRRVGRGRLERLAAVGGAVAPRSGGRAG